jgi:hypothetical protein
MMNTDEFLYQMMNKHHLSAEISFIPLNHKFSYVFCSNYTFFACILLKTMEELNDS